jgi:hypothetical protein
MCCGSSWAYAESALLLTTDTDSELSPGFGAVFEVIGNV